MKKTVIFIVFSLFLGVIMFIPSDRATAAPSEKDVENSWKRQLKINLME